MKMRKMRWWYDFRKYWDWGRCSCGAVMILGRSVGLRDTQQNSPDY